MSRSFTVALSVAAAAGLLALVWWGWQRGGLALLQLGMGSCL